MQRQKFRYKISVIIPTIGRRTVLDAVASVQKSSVDPVNCIVVPDRPLADSLCREIYSQKHTKILKGEYFKGANIARNHGIREAQNNSDYFVFLDDDDSLLPLGLDSLLKITGNSDEKTIHYGKAILKVSGNQYNGVLSPVCLKRREESIGEYLFNNRRLDLSRNSIFLPTVVFPRNAIVTSTFSETLQRHQDWDFLIELENKGFEIIGLDVTVAKISVNANDSISSSADWKSSMNWLHSRKQILGSQVLANALAITAGRYSIQSKSIIGIIRTVASLTRIRRLPDARAWIWAISGLVPRSLLLVLIKKLVK